MITRKDLLDGIDELAYRLTKQEEVLKDLEKAVKKLTPKKKKTPKTLKDK